SRDSLQRIIPIPDLARRETDLLGFAQKRRQITVGLVKAWKTEGLLDSHDFSVAWASRPCIRGLSRIRTGETPMPQNGSPFKDHAHRLVALFFQHRVRFRRLIR